MSSLRKWKEDIETLQRVSVSIIILVLLIVTAAWVMSLDEGSFTQSLDDAVELVLHIEVGQTQYETILFILSFLGLVFMIYLVWVIIDIFLTGKFQERMQGGKIMQKIKKLKDHYVVIGGGSLGEAVAVELDRLGKDVVVLDRDNERVAELNDGGILAMEGDSFEEEYLEAMGVTKAKKVLVCLNDDGDNLLTSLIVKEINPDVKIVAEATYDKYVRQLEKIGVDKVVVPRQLSGVEIAKELAQ